MTTTRTHAAPWTVRRFLACLFGSPRSRVQFTFTPDLLTGREAVARALYFESVQGSALDMLNYDNSHYLRGAWLAEADRRIAAAKSPDRFVAAHHGLTIPEWDQQPALVKKDLREDFYASNGLAS